MHHAAAMCAVRALVGSAARVTRFDNRDHLVVPIVALREAVIWPVNARQPEFVPAHVLALAPQAWNGRPIVGPHPFVAGRQISANQPHVLENRVFGKVFNAEYRDNKLLMEAWLDIARARALGGDPQRVLERALAGEAIEVSVGAFVVTEQRDGTYLGKRFHSVWQVLVPDHLALLPEGERGACSIEMGCGVRAAACGCVPPAGPIGAEALQRLAEAERFRLHVAASFGLWRRRRPPRSDVPEAPDPYRRPEV
jgi:hypothetical protein